MDDKTSSRIRDFVIEVGRRQRQLGAETEAPNRQILASTLRLAGHTVSQNPAASPRPDDPATDGDREQPDDAARPIETARPAVRPALAPMPPSADDKAILDSDEASDAEAAARVDAIPQIDGRAESGDTLSIGDSAPPDNSTPADEALAIEEPSQSNDTAEPDNSPYSDDTPQRGDAPPPDETDADYELLLINDPIPTFDPDSDSSADDPTLSIQPADEGNGGDWLKMRPARTSLDLPSPFADDGSGSGALVNPLAGDTPRQIVLHGDAATVLRPPVSGGPPFYPSPGAGPPFSSVVEWQRRQLGGRRWWRRRPPRSGGGAESGGSRASAERPTIIVQPTAMLTEQLLKSAAEGVLPLAQKTVDPAIDNLQQRNLRQSGGPECPVSALNAQALWPALGRGRQEVRPDDGRFHDGNESLAGGLRGHGHPCAARAAGGLRRVQRVAPGVARTTF